MSFYLGTGGSGKIMHITKGSYTDTAMQGGILPDTVFHSDLDYITYTLYAPDTIEDYIYNSVKYSTRCKVSSTLLAQLLSTKWYFVIYKIAEVWYQYLRYVGNSPTNMLWYPTALSFTGTYYPSSTNPYADIQTGSSQVEACYFVILDNLTTAGYTGVAKIGNDIILRNSDIIVKGVDLFDLRYLNASPINSSDISFVTNLGSMQLINSIVNPSGTMSILSNSSNTEISVSGKILFTTAVSRDKVFYSSTLEATIPYGSVVTSVGGTFYSTIFGPGTFAIGDMFFIKYYADGNVGNDFDSQANSILKFTEGLIYTYSYNFLDGAYTIFLDYYGLANGTLQIRYRISIFSSGTLYSKRYDFKCFKLK